MAVIQVYCPTCSDDHVVKYGMTEQGKQCYFCKNRSCDKKIFLLDYQNKAWMPGVKEKVINMAINGSGIRDTSRVLGIHRDTIMSTLKKSASARKHQSTIFKKC